MTTTTVIAPPGRVRILLAGLATAARRPPRQPVLPTGTLALPERMIEARQVADYAAVCGFDGDGVPLMFAHVLAFPLHMALMMRRGFPFPMAGTVHIANRIEQRAPLAIGDRVRLTARAGRLVAHPRGQAFTIEAAAIRGGVPVWRSTSSYLHRGRPGTGDAMSDPPVDPVAAVARWHGEVGRDVALDYARVSGDRNPIHTSALGARLFGFPRPIAHGMWSLARALAAVAPHAPTGRATLTAAFRAPLLLPGSVVVRADADGRFQLAAAAGDHVHLTGALSC